jgi:hypothetical protein
MQLLKWITSLFNAKSQQDNLDAFITSKNPSTTVEVEYWIQYYDQHKHNGWAL